MPDKWCKHVAAIAYMLIGRCEGDPFYPFTLRQLDIASIRDRPLKRIHDQPNAPNKKVIVIDKSDDEGVSADRPIVL